MSAPHAGAWTRLCRRLATEEPATPLALFRLSVGLVIAVTFASALRLDAIAPVWIRVTDGGVRDPSEGHWLISLLGGATAGVVNGLVVTAILGGATVALGLLGRWPALFTLQICNALFSLDQGTGGGHDKLITNALWLLFLSPATQTLSLDCRLRSGRWTDHRPVPTWPRYLAVFQLALVYGFTGIQKVGSEWFPWGHYEALYDALLLPSWRRWSVGWVGWVFPLTQVGTAVAWHWEVSWPIVLLAFWYRATRDRAGWLRATFNRLDLRSLYIALGVAFHLSLWVLLELGPFSWITMSYYWCAFHADELHRAWARAAAWAGPREGRRSG